jgi:hypothetical protein
MKIVSVNMGKKLKQAGWVLPVGMNNFHQYVTNEESTGIIIDLNFGNANRLVQWVRNQGDRDWVLEKKWLPYDSLIWLPTESDLMDWLEENGFEVNPRIWDQHDDGLKLYECQLREIETMEVIFSDELISDEGTEYTDETTPAVALTRPDAVAKAVLWVMGGKKPRTEE